MFEWLIELLVICPTDFITYSTDIWPYSLLPFSQQLRNGNNPKVSQLVRDEENVVRMCYEILSSCKEEWNLEWIGGTRTDFYWAWYPDPERQSSYTPSYLWIFSCEYTTWNNHRNGKVKRHMVGVGVEGCLERRDSRTQELWRGKGRSCSGVEEGMDIPSGRKGQPDVERWKSDEH